MDFEAEIRDLKRRELEGSFAFLTQQVKAVHVDLLDFRQEFRAFRQEFPEIISGAIGESFKKVNANYWHDEPIDDE